MASFDTTLYTNQTGSAGASPAAGYPLAKDSAGKVRFAAVEYTVDGAEATADTINLCKLKVGAKVIPALSRVISEAAFDVDDMDIGTSDNVNAYADAVDTTNLASDIVFTGGDNNYALAEVTAGNEDVIATLVNVVTTTAAQKVLFLIAYVDE